MLPENSFEIIEAKDGLEGIERIREDKPSLIMLDFLLPKMSGWEVFKALQQEEQWRSIPLVVMSGRKEEVLDKLMLPRTTPYVIKHAPNPTYERRMRRGRTARSINSDEAIRARGAWSPFEF
jgi:CheY-like chemotaxis protein